MVQAQANGPANVGDDMYTRILQCLSEERRQLQQLREATDACHQAGALTSLLLSSACTALTGTPNSLVKSGSAAHTQSDIQSASRLERELRLGASKRHGCVSSEFSNLPHS